MTEATFQTKATEQDGRLDNYGARVKAIEALGGLAPGEASDATVMSHITNPESLSNAAITTEIAGRAGANAKDNGAVGDGVADDAASISALLSAAASFGVRRIVFPAGNYRSTAPLTMAASDVEVVFEAGATISLDSTAFNERPLTISGHRNRILGGIFRSQTRRKFLLAVTGDDNTVSGSTVTHATKSTMGVVPGSSIYYNQGGIEVRGQRNTVERAEASNTEGAGIYLYGDGNKAVQCYTHDNCTGVIVETGATNAAVLDCIITDNNVNFSEGYDGILATCDGLTVRGNLIAGNGEHGTYLHGKNITVSGNTVRGNYYNGIKLGNVDGYAVTGNTLDGNNVSLTSSESQIYIQKSFTYGVVSGNVESRSVAGTFIRAWTDEVGSHTLSITGNTGIGNISFNAERDVVVSGNVTAGDIIVGFDNYTYPALGGAVVTGNKANRIHLTRCTAPLVGSNTVKKITATANPLAAIIQGNLITAQDARIPLLAVAEFSGNIITFTMAMNAESLFQQHTSKLSGGRFVNNDFKSSGGRFLHFTSESISSDNLTISGNSFSGALQPLYFWGAGHQIVGNRADLQMGYLGCNNSIITGNIKEPSMRTGLTGNVFANNIP